MKAISTQIKIFVFHARIPCKMGPDPFCLTECDSKGFHKLFVPPTGGGKEEFMNLEKIYMLQLFAEGEASGGSTEGTGDAGQSNVGTAATGVRGTEKVKVLYGKQPAEESADVMSDPGAQTDDNSSGNDSTDSENTPTPEDRERAYKDFIKANKDIHTRETQKIINRCFREQKALEEEIAKRDGILELFHAKYGTDDLDALEAKVKGDTKLFSDEAEALGMDEEQYANMMQMKLKAQKYDAMQRQSAEAEKNRRFNERLAREEAEMRESLPDFSLKAEIDASPEFVRMLKSGVSVKAAYNAIHNDEITAAAIRHAQAAAAKAAAENVRARGNRPRENGNGNAPGVIVKSDVSKLTRAERAEIAQRTLAGEKISF